MWTTVAVVAALSLAPNQADSLSLTHVRSTHGMLGPTRTEDKVLPGESVFLSFDIEGITVDDKGMVHYSMGTEVTDSKGKVLFKRDPRNLDAPVTLGGHSVPAYARVDVGLEQPPGVYTLKVTVTDIKKDAKQTLSREIEVLPKDFGLVRLTYSSDSEGLLRVVVPGCGEALWIHFGAVGFARDAAKQPNVSIAMRVIDANGKATLSQPTAAEVTKDVPDNAMMIPLRFLLHLNRPGKFTVELTATDKISNKSAKLTFPLTVQAP
jgi:hypothetical protein